MEQLSLFLLPLLFGWFADRELGDPEQLPHPVVGFGKVIKWAEKRFNYGEHRIFKGAVVALLCVISTYVVTAEVIRLMIRTNELVAVILISTGVFFCLAGKTLTKEVRQVFEATSRSVEEGRIRVSRIVGRDTSTLSAQQIRTAALETLAENLSDGVIAPLFWYCLLGLPGMMAYKMINTLDSMIGYKNERYLEFGKFAAILDDVANFIPARITASLMLLSQGIPKGSMQFVRNFGRMHASPNSGFPEAALASILNCRFGGPNCYLGELVEKPYIGTNQKVFTDEDMKLAVTINEKAEILMVIVVMIGGILLH